MQSISFERFFVQAGSDSSGVATEMVTMNSTVKFNFRNKGTFFGVHVKSTPLDLSYSQLTVATGIVSLPSIQKLHCINFFLFIYLFFGTDEEFLSVEEESQNGDGNADWK